MTQRDADALVSLSVVGFVVKSTTTVWRGVAGPSCDSWPGSDDAGVTLWGRTILEFDVVEKY